jgi:uncharacterized membrane protein YtjA (UPF0391 family)
MFGWSVANLVIAIVAALYGFGGGTGALAWLARLLFGICLILFLLLLFLGRSPPRQ